MQMILERSCLATLNTGRGGQVRRNELWQMMQDRRTIKKEKERHLIA
jgi:hypothetical protein